MAFITSMGIANVQDDFKNEVFISNCAIHL